VDTNLYELSLQKKSSLRLSVSLLKEIAVGFSTLLKQRERGKEELREIASVACGNLSMTEEGGRCR